MRDERVHLPLAGLHPLDSHTREPCDLGALAGVHVLTLIRHRY
jgi:hypothetical protein